MLADKGKGDSLWNEMQAAPAMIRVITCKRETQDGGFIIAGIAEFHSAGRNGLL
jgi:hypothetical protein